MRLNKPICEVGSGRSGTNFLAMIISQHEDIAFLRQPKYTWRYGNAWWPDDCLTVTHARPEVVKYIRKVFSKFLNDQGKKRFFENTQANVLSLPFVNSVLPDSKIIHIIRDGRDVAASLKMSRETRKTRTIVKSARRRISCVPLLDRPAYFLEFIENVWRQALNNEGYTFGPKIKNWKTLYKKYDLLEFSAITWKECVSSARNFGKTLPKDRYHEIFFEDLFVRPDDIINDLLNFLELPPSDSVKGFLQEKIDPTAKGRYQKRLSEKELDQILYHTSDLLSELNFL